METRKLARLSFDNISKKMDSSLIENFIIADSSKFPKGISVKHPFSFDGLVFGICLKGHIKFRINFKEYEISENMIFTILPYNVFEPIEKSEDSFVEILVFSIDFFVNLPLPKDMDMVHCFSVQPVLKVSDEDMSDLLEFHSFIVKSFNKKKNADRTHITRCLLVALIAEIGVIYKEEKIEERVKPSSRSESIAEQFFKLLRENVQFERSASFYADKLCISIKYLSGTLKKVTGRSVNSWIDEAVIIGAKILLKTSDMTVLQVSEELNFPNPSFFGRFFKQHVGMTPLEYREA